MKIPLLLDGDSIGIYSSKVQPKTCVQKSIIENSDVFKEIQQDFANVGADYISAPTGGLTTMGLSTLGVDDDAYQMNKFLVKLAYSTKINCAGIIESTGHLPEPYGPLPFTDLIDTYAEQAIELATSGAKLIILQNFNSLGDARAAVIGARQAQCPLVLILTVEANENIPFNPDPLALLISLQELGLNAFGIYHEDINECSKILEKLKPYAKIPLMAKVNGEDYTPENLSKACFELLASGARILAGGKGTSPEHIKSLRKLIDNFDFSAFEIQSQISKNITILTDEMQVFYIEKCTNIPIINLLECSEDINLIEINTVAEAYDFGQKPHISDKAIIILSNSPEALEMALLYYRGRAVVSSKSAIEFSVLEELAKGYGAVII